MIIWRGFAYLVFITFFMICVHARMTMPSVE